MSYRVSVIEVVEILRLWLQGLGLREVARLSGADRKTVRRYVDRARACGLDRAGGDCQLTDELIAAVIAAVRPSRPTGKSQPWETVAAEHEQIRQWLKDGLTLTKIHTLLGRRGVVVSFRTLHRCATTELDFDRSRPGSRWRTANRARKSRSTSAGSACSPTRETSEALELAEQSGEDITLFGAGINRCIVLVHRGGPERAEGVELLMQVRARGLKKGFSGQGLPVADIYIASEKARSGDFDGAIGQIRQVLNDFYASGGSIWNGLATTVLVEALMARGADGDLAEAGAAIDRLAGVPTDPRFVLYEITLLRLRALLARARGDEAAYRDYRDRYRDMATSLGFEGHIAWAEAMP